MYTVTLEYAGFGGDLVHGHPLRAQHRNIQAFRSEELRPVPLETDKGVIRYQRIMDQLLAAERDCRRSSDRTDGL